MATITGIEENEFPEFFRTFEQIIDPKTWFRIHHNISGEIRGKRFLRDYLIDQNRVAFELAALSKEYQTLGGFQQPLINSKTRYEVCTLVAQFVEHYRTAPNQYKNTLKGRLCGALKNNLNDLRAMQFEWLVATHLKKQNFDVEFPEQTKNGTIDLRATRGAVTIDIECKSISKNHGNKIHERDALELYAMLHEATRKFAKNINVGMVVRVVLTGRAPTSHAERKALCKRIIEVVFSGKSVMADDLDVHIMEFDVKDSPIRDEEIDKNSLREFLGDQFGIRNSSIFLTYYPSKRSLIFSLESRTPDTMLDYMFDVIKDAHGRQLKGTHPSIICVKLEGLSASELEEIGKERGFPTPLRRYTSQFLDSRRNSHLVAISFLADGPIEKMQDGAITQTGSSYFFDNPDSPLYLPEAVEVFRSGLQY